LRWGHCWRTRLDALILKLCGRRAEALAAYQDARKALIGELGIEPGQELRRLHERILADDDGDPAGANAAAQASAPVNTVATRNDFLIGHCPSRP
jgi:DNA-binding SARP family transcriptional activator